MAPLQQRVDPRPVRQPAMGLLASANNVVVGSDYDLPERVNPTDVESASDAAGPLMPVADTHPAADIERPAIGQPVLWIRGFSYRPEVCNGGGRIDPEGTTGGTASTIESQINVVPYVVHGSDQRSTFGAPTQGEYDEARQYARRQLLACEGKQIETELWGGKLSDGSSTGNRHLTSSDVDLVEGDRLLGYLTALAVLEQAINDGTCGQQGMIHCRADTATMWVSEHLAHRVGNLLLTELGTIIVAGSGYDGSAPDAGTVGLDPAHAGVIPSADSAWAYATTVVDVRRSAFISSQPILERVDQTSNTLTTFERRVAAATWGCLHAGVHVDHVNKITTTGS